MSVTLHADEEQLLAAFAAEGSADRQALVDWAVDHHVAEPTIRSDAALLRVLVRAGAEAIRARTMDVGYAALALSYGPDEDAERRSARHRYAERTDRNVGD